MDLVSVFSYLIAQILKAEILKLSTKQMNFPSLIASWLLLDIFWKQKGGPNKRTKGIGIGEVSSS